MMSVEEMRALLLREYGIRNDADLDKELARQGGIKIAIFTDSTDKTEKV